MSSEKISSVAFAIHVCYYFPAALPACEVGLFYWFFVIYIDVNCFLIMLILRYLAILVVRGTILLLVSRWFLEGFDNQAEADGTTSLWACLFWMGQFHCNPRTLPISGCFDDVINLFWRQTQQADLRGQGRCGSDFTRVHLRYATLISLGWKAAWWRQLVLDEPGFVRTEDCRPLASSEPMAKC